MYPRLLIYVADYFSRTIKECSPQRYELFAKKQNMEPLKRMGGSIF